jgi:hypothetical protein
MRRFLMTVMCSVILPWAIPSHAYAWWEFIEELSGPGRFYGWDMQFRVFCVVDKIDTSRSGDKIASTEKIAPTAAGVVISFCRPRPKDANAYYSRRLAVDIGAHFLSAKDNDAFAHGQKVDLTILKPTVTMNLLNRFPKWDFVDFGAGGGVYWFASSEFPTTTGFVIEPVRIELHPSTAMKESKWSALFPILRFGWLSFPLGFDRAQWAPQDPLPLRTGRDTTFNFSLAFDLETLFR